MPLVRSCLAALLMTLAACMPQAGPETRPPGLPDDADRDVFLTLVSSISQGGKPQAALAYLDDYLARYPEDDRALLLKAEALARAGDLPGAEAVFASLILDRPIPEALAGLARVAGRQGRWETAVTHFAAAHAAMPSDPALLNDYGYALLMTGRLEPAFRLLASAHELTPNDSRIRTNFLIAAQSAGRTRDVERLLSPLPPAERQHLHAFIRNWEPGS